MPVQICHETRQTRKYRMAKEQISDNKVIQRMGIRTTDLELIVTITGSISQIFS